MKVLDYGAERKWQGLSALSVPLLPKPRNRRPFMLLLRSQTFCSSSRFTFARVSVIHSANQ